ncbi:ATP-binding protein [Longispora albida]|uniref:ATP-binding protein n=1 Tax=Longispora albida TaxID=203523 RepID=UPI00037D6AD8|nr:ATP-binding protein [Longispora albida]
MFEFIGRQRELRIFGDLVARIRDGIGGRAPGECLLIGGRRRIGKSSLVEEYLRQSGLPRLFFTAAQGGDPLADLADAVAESTLPGRTAFQEDPPGTWAAAFRRLAEALPDDEVSVVVIDEVPYLMDDAKVFESNLQRAWDRELSRKPVLLLLVGSDLSMMEALNTYDRPFHQRGREMVIGPLNPAEIGSMLGLEPAAAFDAALITGGLPLICAEWTPGQDVWGFLTSALSNPVSALLVSAERSLAAEVPAQAQAREVLSAIGSGERTFTNIARAAGGVAHTSLSRAIEVLVAKRIVAAELPLATKPSKERRYRIADPYLRFWLTFIAPHMAEIERMSGDVTVERVRRSWTSWRGRAVEPLVREALARILPAHGIPAAPVVGGYWTRSNDVEIDIVGADREPIAREYLFLGSVKWLENSPFDGHDLASLAKARSALTADPVPLVAVARSGVTCAPDAHFGPAELITGWTA